ncbi:hypothetical protein VNO80_24754 [Phaseolus coccineus]|uniref:Epidermal patterning factor-like protein n=1 Tax=Phaseolus coccineus TaxID=3886 RepID=A0AAN9LT00_PHACN
MFTTLKQTHLCRNVFFLFLLCTLILSSSAASSKGMKPCKAILVATPPAAHQQTYSASGRPNDYLPLVWRCTCGGKLYNPK